jgi:hypothetical protein
MRVLSSKDVHLPQMVPARSRTYVDVLTKKPIHPAANDARGLERKAKAAARMFNNLLRAVLRMTTKVK